MLIYGSMVNGQIHPRMQNGRGVRMRGGDERRMTGYEQPGNVVGSAARIR